MRLALTDLAIRKLPHPERGQVRYWDTHLPAFGLQVGKRSKTFICMYGKERRLKTLGRYPAIGLQDARTAAKRQLLEQPSPQAIRTLREASTAFLADCGERLRPSSTKRYRDVLQHAPEIPLGQAKKSLATTAHEIKAYKALFNWCIREEITDRNPFLHVPTVYTKRDRVLNDEELRAVWQYDREPVATMLRLLILTGQRKGQIWHLKPEWVGEDTIRFPAEIMKQGKPHTIPISPETRELAQRAPFSFNGWSKAKPRIDRVTGVTDWTIHDLRRTFATEHAKLGTPIHVVEALLAHTSGTISGVAAIYVRHNFLEEARAAQLRYEAKIHSIVAPRGS